MLIFDANQRHSNIKTVSYSNYGMYDTTLNKNINMMISARYKHFLYFPLRLIDYRSPEVRENKSSSCRIIKIHRSTLPSHLGSDAAPVFDDPRPQFSRAWFLNTVDTQLMRGGEAENTRTLVDPGDNKYYKSVSASRNLLHRRNSTLDKTGNEIHENLLILENAF